MGDATKLAFAVFLISCSSGGCGEGYAWLIVSCGEFSAMLNCYLCSVQCIACCYICGATQWEGGGSHICRDASLLVPFIRILPVWICIVHAADVK